MWRRLLPSTPLALACGAWAGRWKAGWAGWEEQKGRAGHAVGQAGMSGVGSSRWVGPASWGLRTPVEVLGCKRQRPNFRRLDDAGEEP